MPRIYTAQYRYFGPNRLDITVKTGLKAFAPTWDMVIGYKDEKLSETAYQEKYLAMLSKSVNGPFRKQWQDLFAMDETVLVCFCATGQFCHRILLAKWLEKQYGFPYCGEIIPKNRAMALKGAI